jgi:outer membrane protein assembly factor BamB
MKIHKQWLWIIISGIIISCVCSYYFFYSSSAILRFSAVNFPLKKLWSQSLNSTVVHISTSSDNSEILVRTNSALFALETADGNIIWNLPLSKQIDDSPAISTAKMVFVTDSDSLRALNINDGRIVWEQSLPQSSGRLVDVSESLVLVNQASYDIRAYDTQSGRLLWSVPVARGFVPAYINKDVVYIADYGIRAVDAATGKSAWLYGNNAIGASTYRDGIIYYTSENEITAFNTQTKTKLWNVTLPDNGFRRFKLDNDFLFVMDESNLYEFDTSKGTIVWQADISHPMNPAIIGDNIYVLEGFSRIIRVFNLTTKKEIGHVRVSAPHLLVVDMQNMFSSTDILLFSTGQDIFAYK